MVLAIGNLVHIGCVAAGAKEIDFWRDKIKYTQSGKDHCPKTYFHAIRRSAGQFKHSCTDSNIVH